MQFKIQCYSIAAMSSFHSFFHQRAEIMAVGIERKALLGDSEMAKMVARLRAKLSRGRQCLEKQKAKVKQKEIKCSKRRKWNEFLWKEDACIRHGIVPTLGILDAENEGDFVRADHLRQSRSELVAKHMEETQNFFNGGLN